MDIVLEYGEAVDAMKKLESEHNALIEEIGGVLSGRQHSVEVLRRELDNLRNGFNEAELRSAVQRTIDGLGSHVPEHLRHSVYEHTVNSILQTCHNEARITSLRFALLEAESRLEEGYELVKPLKVKLQVCMRDLLRKSHVVDKLKTEVLRSLGVVAIQPPNREESHHVRTVEDQSAVRAS